MAVQKRLSAGVVAFHLLHILQPTDAAGALSTLMQDPDSIASPMVRHGAVEPSTDDEELDLTNAHLATLEHVDLPRSLTVSCCQFRL